MRAISGGHGNELSIFKVATGSRTKSSFKGALESVRAFKADGLRDRSERFLSLRKSSTRFVETKIFHKVARWLSKEAFEYFTKVTGAHARSTSEHFYRKIGMEISNYPGN